MRSIGIRSRLILAFLVVSIIPIIAVGTITSLSFSRALNDQVAMYSSQLVAQMAKNMAETFDRMVALTESLIVDPGVQAALKDTRRLTDMQKRQLYLELDANLSRLIYRNAKVHDVNIFRNDGSLLTTTGYLVYRPEEMARILGGIAQSRQNMFWTATTTARGNRLIVVSRLVYDEADTNRAIGSLVIMLDEKSFARNAFYGVHMGKEAELQLVARDGTIISAAGRQVSDGEHVSDGGLVRRLDDIADELPNSFSWPDRNGTSLICATAIPQEDWLLVARIPGLVVKQLSRQMIGNIAVACLVVILLICSVASPLFFSIQIPLKRLTCAAKAIQRGEFSWRIGDPCDDEVGQVSQAIDDMAARLAGLIDDIQQRQEEKRRIELEILQSQINPHFLFNTLDSLKWTAMLHGNALVGEGIGALSSLLRNGVLASGDRMTLAEEIRNLQSYALILRLRYGDSFRLEIDAEPEALACQLPKLLLQPFVENAIIHGRTESDGTLVSIRLSARVDDQALHIEIADDGRGFDPDLTTEKNTDRYSGIGIANVRERIRLWYGEPWGMTIVSEPGRGTQALLRLPAQKGGVAHVPGRHSR